ncbi:MAG: hypothetical protein LBR76_01815 [Oscillospiraceae bacterium]|jgi:predicted phage-related endonuclease|nr:hypothetical protein [Oscillospiraceae bacterium]
MRTDRGKRDTAEAAGNLKMMKEAHTMSTADLTGTARTYRQLMADIKALEEQADALKQTMIRELDARKTEELTAGEYTIRWSLYESSRLDSAKLKAEHADLYAAYCKRTTATRFQVA